VRLQRRRQEELWRPAGLWEREDLRPAFSREDLQPAFQREDVRLAAAEATR
jgi:hypothetical protein